MAANRLASATSPYLLQHADNPVHWQQWSDEAFAEAAARNVPVFLSVGYAACHWCHVMAHESFEDEATAALINTDYVAIKVDREERPDVDAVYMTATQALTGQGGWPMSVFLTPDRRPFYAGTYYPPEPRHGMPSFREVLSAVSTAWTARRDEVLASAATIETELSGRRPQLDHAITDTDLDAALAALGREFDPLNGGFGRAPKFPPSMVLEALLRYDDTQAHTTNHAPGPEARDAVDALLDEPFGNWHVETTTETHQVRVTKKLEAMVHTSARAEPAHMAAPAPRSQALRPIRSEGRAGIDRSPFPR